MYGSRATIEPSQRCDPPFARLEFHPPISSTHTAYIVRSLGISQRSLLFLSIDTYAFTVRCSEACICSNDIAEELVVRTDAEHQIQHLMMSPFQQYTV